ncbi:MAG: DNA repair protein RadA [Desulfobacteraceae bacterium]|nr:MAG: DNA repair protein RadA [Desulfobacteraceae bacterium]
MSKPPKIVFVCQSCGYQAPKWLGRCPDCSSWNSFAEERPALKTGRHPELFLEQPQALQDISLDPQIRIKTGILEFDRILGGGIVPGSLVLIGGDPGIGKSTLVLQVAARFALQGLKALYFSGEESAQQLKLRSERLEIQSDQLFVLCGTCLEHLLEKLEGMSPRLLIVDSIQTVYTETLPSAPGNVGQIREVTLRLLTWAKKSGVPTFLIGHVTKDGAIAGPKVLEHLVDTVLYFEGERLQSFRILRAVKNRFGATNEIGVFEMLGSGLQEVNNPSRLFLEERPEASSGSVVLPCLEGSRPLLVELQALVGQSPFGIPRRTAIGVDANRVSLLVAVLGKRMGMEMGGQDIFVNVAGGLRVDEPAADLAIVAAMISSYTDRPVARRMAIFGEIGLAGEIRGVNQPELRLKEAQKLGFTKCILPKSNLAGLGPGVEMELVGVDKVKGLLEVLF